MPIRTATGLTLIAAALMLGYVLGLGTGGRIVLSPTETVLIEESGQLFHARLDTGAVVSSINAHQIEVVGGGSRPSRDDVGRTVRFVLVNGLGARRAVEAEIAQVRGIRMADCREVRYHVYLPVKFRGEAQWVLVNLNDRTRSGDKLLLGRNWLHQGYAVGPVAENEI